MIHFKDFAYGAIRAMKLKNVIICAALTFALFSCTPTAEQRKQDADLHYQMGMVHFSDRAFAEALKELSLAIEKYPEDASYHNGLGLAYFARGINDKAIEQFSAAVAIDNMYSDAHLNLSAVYMEQKDWDRAITSAQNALKNVFYKMPENAYNNIGWALYRKGEYAKSIESYKKAVEINPQYAMAFNNMAMAYERANKPDDALAAYRAAINIDQNIASAQYGAGMLLLQKEDRAGAIRAFKKVIEVAPESELGLSATGQLELLKK